jgi:hypothetical protein
MHFALGRKSTPTEAMNKKSGEKKSRQLLEKSKHRRVLCINDANIREDATFPKGKVRRGQIYAVIATMGDDGFVILGKPVMAPEGLQAWRADRFKVIA